MSSVDPVHKSVYIEGKKTFVPLENNPVVFDALIRSLGVSSSLSFYDIWSIDSDEALAHVPRPVDFPPGVTDVKTLPQYEGYGDKEPVIWYKQTIRHACGLIALLHSINAVPTSFIDQDSVISTLVKTVTPLQVEERADVLYNSPELEQLHMQAAQQGDTPAPSSAEENGFHFIAFVKGKDGNLWELEGGWNGPICRGKLDNDTDVLSKAALNAGIDPFLKAAERSGEMGFSMIALAPASAD
ncbi:hypothetical protein MBLNU459_g3202t2 [Dothideomycetes sp. NU459]